MPRGSCLCGAVTVEVEGPLGPTDACHCTMCRKWSGHYWASTEVPRERLTVHGAENVSWYESSAKVRRGFCRTCGSVMFFDPPHRDWTALGMGAFDNPTGVHLGKHIFVGDKGDYYEIADGLPQESASPAPTQ